MKRYLISVLCRDRIGIIANVSGAIERLGGNLGDLRQNVLDDYFSMILIASFPDTAAVEKIRKDLSSCFSRIDSGCFSIEVWPDEFKAPSVSQAKSEEKYVLTASAEDRKGLVAEVSAFCLKHDLNILSLNTDIRDDMYNMIFLLDAEKSSSLKTIRQDLKVLEKKSGLKLMFQHYKIFKATNEIKI